MPRHVARGGAQRALPGARVLRSTARLLLLVGHWLLLLGPALARAPVALLVLLLLLVVVLVLLGRRLRVALAQRAQHAPRALLRRRRVLDDLPQRPHAGSGHRLARLAVHVERLHAALELRQPLVELHHAQQREDAHRGAAHQLARAVHGAPLGRLVLWSRRRRAQQLVGAAAARGVADGPAPVHRDAGAQQRDEDLGRQPLAARQPVAQAAELAPRREVVGQRQRPVVPERRVQLAHQLRGAQLAPAPLVLAAAAAAAAALRHLPRPARVALAARLGVSATRARAQEHGLAGPARRRGGAGRQEPGRALRAALPGGRHFALLHHVQGGPAAGARPRGPRRPVLPAAEEHPVHAAVDGVLAVVVAVGGFV